MTPPRAVGTHILGRGRTALALGHALNLAKGHADADVTHGRDDADVIRRLERVTARECLNLQSKIDIIL